MRSRAGAIIVGSICLLAVRVAPAADRPVDPGLLEFLGSVDSEDKDWHEYLAHTDIDKVARRAGQPRRVPPAADADPPPPPRPPPPDGTTPSGPPPKVSPP